MITSKQSTTLTNAAGYIRTFIVSTICLSIIFFIGFIIISPRYDAYKQERHTPVTYMGNNVMTQILDEIAKTDAHVQTLETQIESMYYAISLGLIFIAVTLGLLIILFSRKNINRQ